MSKKEIYSFFPVDPIGCICEKLIQEEKKKLALSRNSDEYKEKRGPIVCPRDKTGMRRFVVTCTKCKQVQGYCWAKDETLKDWCDFHYYLQTDGNKWEGCFSPQKSPITGELHLECCCGNDTRDMRLTSILPDKVARKMEKSNSKGRDFGSKSSKFNVKEFKGTI